MSKRTTPARRVMRASGRLPVVVAGLAVAAAALIALLAWGQGRGLPAPAAAGSLPREVSVAEAAALRDSGAFVLDVREPSEWEAYHLPGATLIPLGELAARLDELPRDREIVIVCRSGNRSGSGRDILLDAGFANVTSLAGGLLAWQAQGLPAVSGP